MDRSYINPPELLDTIDNGLQGRPPQGTRVLVLGAGMAGLVAATELQRAGYEVEIVEARTRVGGRIHTLREPFSHGLYAEAGAMRVPSCHELVLRYVRRFGLPLKPFRSHNDNGWCFVHYERRRLRDALKNPAIGIDPELCERDGIDLQEMWRAVLEPLIALLAEDPDGGWSVLAERLQDISLYDFLRNEGWSDAVIETYGLLAGFETLLFASAFEFVREFLLGLRDDTVAIPGGMDQLSNAFLPALRGCIRYGTPVTALDQDESGVTVYVRRGAVTEALQGDFAIVTIPLPVLRHIEVLTPFSRTKQRAIRSVHYEAATKIFFEMRERFWETREGIWGGASVTDLAIRNIYYPEHGRDTGRGVLLASYSHGQDAHRWGALTPEARLAEALENLIEIHPEAGAMVEGGASVCWSHDPFAGGAYSFFQPHQESLLHDSIAMPEGRFFLAGEHASRQHRWLQGAVESALRVAGDIHSRVMSQHTMTAGLESENDVRPPGLLDDPESLAAGSGDFGGIWQLEPRFLLRPRDSAEIAGAVAYARSHGLPVAARGVGHSAGAQSQVEGGVAIDMTALRDIRRIDAVNHRIEVDAGARWQEVMDALLPLGLTPAVVTDWLHLTLGGTVSAGGVGAQSFRRGIQADLVESMKVVTGTGEIVDCSREREAELFDAVRGGLGQFGIITRIEMQLVDAPAAVLLDHLVYDDLERFCADMESLTATDSAVEGLLAHAVANDLETIARS
jgi:monoamine oxidase